MHTAFRCVANQIILMAVFIFCLLFYATVVHASGTFAGGDGSSGTPYQIVNCTQLQAISSNLSSYFILNNDIDCYDTINWNGGNGFAMIGTYSGVFDGQHHSINDLYMGPGNRGLFQAVSGTVQNLGLDRATVYSPGNAYVGTLVGTLLGGTLSQVFATGAVTGVSYAGGLVGWHQSGLITNVYARVAVTGTYSGGGIGRNDASIASSSYATGVAGTATQSGFIGYNFGGSTVNVFYDGQLMGVNDTNGSSTGKTTAQMKSVATYTTNGTIGLTSPWDFVGNPNNDVGVADIWNISSTLNDGYPYLTWQIFDQTAPTIINISSSVADGTYKVGDVIPINVTFSKNVTSTGPVTITLALRPFDRTCTFVITHNTTGTCNYTVQTGDMSSHLDVRSVSGTIADRAGNAMTNFIPTASLAAQKTLVVDTTVTPAQTFFYGGTSITQQVANLIAMGNTQMADSIKGKWQNLFPAAVVVPTSTHPTSTVSVPTFLRDLKLGMAGVDIRLLQQYLNTHGFILAKTGLGSFGNETDSFGILTKKAITAYQNAHHITPASGYFGSLTRALLQSTISSASR
jgi:hypothetical protein